MGDCFIRKRITSRLPMFTYTGDYEVIDDGHGNWRVKFLSSGTLTFTTITNKVRDGLDVFLVGGGGVTRYDNHLGSVGVGYGGGGYTKTVKKITVAARTAYPIVVGGSAQASTAFGQTANPGENGKTEYYSDSQHAIGGKGGSGGAASSSTSHGSGGRNGGDGSGGSYTGFIGVGGKGQGTTTGEFGDPNATQYSRGGGASTPREPNTGNGGRGVSGERSGCSGIVIIRNHRE